MSYGLTSEMTADAALRQVLRCLFEAMQSQEEGVRAGRDPDCLHDFRVAVRRTRSALGQLKRVLPDARVATFRSEFAWLGSLTGTARDLDVYLLHFPDFETSLPPEVRDDLLPFRRYLEIHRTKEYGRLRRQLAGQRYQKLAADWRGFLADPPSEEAASYGARPARKVAVHRIWKAYRRVLSKGRAIQAASPAEDLHELRKSCKKLRYLMEFFQDLFPAKRMARMIQALRELQDHLGSFQDVHVQVEALRRFSREMVAETPVPPETLIAMGRLVAGLDIRQSELRAEFFTRFSRFAREQNRVLFRKLLKSL